MYTLGNRYVITPSPNTLKSMFGDTKPISYFADTEYSEKMLNALSNEEKISAICDYAETLHDAQYEYDQISHYGGYDITVQQVDEIALNEVFRLFNGEELSEALSLLRTKLYVRNIRLIYTEGIIESYQKLQKMPQQLEKQYADYQLAKADFEKKVRSKALEISEHGASEYKKYEQQFNEIQNSTLKKLLSKIPWSRTHKELTSISDSMERALSDVAVSDQYVIENFFEEDKKPMYSAPHYWSPINSDEPEMKIIETSADLNAAIKEIHEQLFDSKNKEAYERCVSFSQIPVDSSRERVKEKADDFENRSATPDKKQHETHSQKPKHRKTDFVR